MDRRDFLQAGGAALAWSALHHYAAGAAAEKAQTRRTDRQRLVRQKST